MEPNFQRPVRDWQGRIVAYLCFNCNEPQISMWGMYCNKCREEERRHKEILKAIKERK